MQTCLLEHLNGNLNLKPNQSPKISSHEKEMDRGRRRAEYGEEESLFSDQKTSLFIQNEKTVFCQLWVRVALNQCGSHSINVRSRMHYRITSVLDASRTQPVRVALDHCNSHVSTRTPTPCQSSVRSALNQCESHSTTAVR